MKKKPWIVVLFALLVIAAVSFTLSSGSAKDAVPQTGNLIANGDFSILEDGQPKSWETGMWVTSAGASYLEAVTLADGTTAALVENAASNDARFEQAVAVRENTTYKLTARVMAEECGEGKTGANLSFIGIYARAWSMHDTGRPVADRDALCAHGRRAARGDRGRACGRLWLGEHRQGLVYRRDARAR